ncbi:hypothetical protein VD0002_g4875 [Verticillium dahliae]|uniref:DUF5672 domain-containing protein n=2 Tax=Verticillium dahliae TaxID=27337 RepID=G2XHP1_VERDV|nr:uncharacterized protein VDAG_09795 [Verticillium dahliae VdLs.17]KAF3344212.1 hypothetical protein VdG2_07684 [Verticillium dahliae VDG2]KAH6704463.1 hypothetical protein EV126DRAFT_414235 [Verticillium dahliae]EGY19335.1 hypothetical protein VDAG_09795 [Verticillium dahliae VdLs.17]PNH27790.1 hypothetical protein BJF96_g8911 [Verticillium dahliae]PNH40526.1 hypothetical protein VD0004_g6468 [Verticillium dahliae]
MESSTAPSTPDEPQNRFLALWNMTSKRMRSACGLVIFLGLTIWLSLPSIKTMTVPQVSLHYGVKSPFNHTKVALLIENRPNPILAPLMLHFMAVVPPDWRFRFMGSEESVAHINQSMAIREHVNSGKLDLTFIPSNMSTAGQEMISRFLTNLWLYETVLHPAEWLLVFQTDSMLCANSRHNINDFLEFDWIGAPWNPSSRWGGNGGLSLRRVSAIIDVLREQVRVDNSEPEDVWLTERLAHRPGARTANSTISIVFSGEGFVGEKVKVGSNSDAFNSSLDAAAAGEYVPELDSWRDGFYEPMGYHTGGSGAYLHGPVWGKPSLRKHIWDYCPEIKMTLAMDAAEYIPGHCNDVWRRDGSEAQVEAELDARYPFGSEIIDGEEYPLLPPGLSAW